MTCAQGLLRLLWGGGGPKLECYGTVFYDRLAGKTLLIFFCNISKMIKVFSLEQSDFK